VRARNSAGALLSLLLAAPMLSAVAAGFSVREASVIVVNDIYTVTGQLDFDFSAEALEALESGVSLTVRIEIEFLRPRRYLWDPTVARTVRSYRLKRHELSNQFLVINSIAGSQESFRSLSAAIEAMQELEPIPVLERHLMDRDRSYLARMRALLDIEELPAPMRPVAYLSSGWRLSSGWYDWEFAP
jgi:hypothetical protein